jgi:hypothetical protein
MKAVIALLSLVAALALATAAGATPNKTTRIAATLVGDGCSLTNDCGSGGGGSCGCESDFFSFVGSTNISPPLGSLTFTGLYENSYFCSQPTQDENGNLLPCPVPLTYSRLLVLTLTAPNGGKLVLGEEDNDVAPFSLLSEATPVSGAWTVDPAASTGRFARYSGSGTYTLSIEPHDTYATFTLVLDGSLTFQ